jgi:hypothetical protein
MAHLADCLQYLREGKKSGNYQQIVKSKWKSSKWGD